MTHGREVTGQLAFPEERPLSPRIVRALRRGPVTRPSRPSRASRVLREPAARSLAEWHEMTSGEQLAIWGRLRAWVTWLHDRYELATEDRLPRCWPAHPGLVEELYALMVWREEIYTGGQASGQAARYWHAELRQVLQAAATMYAAGCRTGHRGAPHAAATDSGLCSEWAAASPLTGIPAADQVAGRARRAADGWVPASAIAQALDAGFAEPFLGLAGEYVACGGTLWAPAASGWTTVKEQGDD
jgi:hypothetical protein